MYMLWCYTLDCITNGNSGSTYIHVFLQLYMILVFLDFQISGNPEIPGKYTFMHVYRQTYIGLYMHVCIYESMYLCM